MAKQIHKTIKESFWNRSFSLIKNNPKIFLWMFLLDLGFIGVFMLLEFLTGLIVPSDPYLLSQMQANTMLLIGILLLLAVYVIAVVLAYSFFNLIIFGNIKSMYLKHKHDFSMLKSMFSLNLLIFLVFFVMFVLFNMLRVFLIDKSVWIALVSLVVVAVGFIWLYVFSNFAHSALVLGKEWKDAVKSSLKSIFTRSYLGLVIFNVVVVALALGILIAAQYLFSTYFLEQYDTLVRVVMIVFIIVIYLLLSFNRVYFFLIYEKKHAKAKK